MKLLSGTCIFLLLFFSCIPLFPKHPIPSRLYTTLVLSIGFWILCLFQFSETASLYWARLLPIGLLFGVTMLLLFSLHYPRKLFPLSWWHLGLILLFPCLGLLALPTPYIIAGVSPQGALIYGPARALVNGNILIYLFLGLIIMGKGLKIFKGIEQIKIYYLFFGFLISSMPLIVTNIILPTFDIHHFRGFGLLGVPVYLGFISFLFLKYPFILSRNVLKVATSTALQLILISLLLVIIIATLMAFINISALSTKIALSVLISVLLVIFFPYIRLFSHTIITFFFSGNRPKFEESLKTYCLELSQKTDLPQIQRSIEKTLCSILDVRDITLYIVKNDQFENIHTEKSSHCPKSFSFSHPIIQALNYKASPLLKKELENYQQFTHTSHYQQRITVLLKTMSRLNISMCLPLLFQKSFIGIVLIGEKSSTTSFYDIDIPLFESLASHLSLAVQNVSYRIALTAQYDHKQRMNLFTHQLLQQLDPTAIYKHTASILEELFDITAMLFFENLDNTTTFQLRYISHAHLPKDAHYPLTIYKDDVHLPHQEKSYLTLFEFYTNGLEIEKKVGQYFSEFFPHVSKTSLKFFPLMHNNTLLGGIWASIPTSLTSDKLLLKAILHTAASTLHKSRLYTEVQNRQVFSQNTLDNLSDAIFILDNYFIITNTNKKASQLFQKTDTDMLEKPLSFVLESEELATHIKSRPSSFFFKETFLHLSGSIIPVTISVHPLLNTENEDGAFIAVITDISKIHALHLQIEQEKRLASLGTSAAKIAHEIKNPLATMSAFSEILSNQWDQANIRQSFMQTTLPQIQRVEKFCADLLDLSKPLKHSFTSVNLWRLFETVQTSLYPTLLETNILITLQVSQSLHVWGDKEQLRQLMHNLVMNSIQALSKNTERRISIKALKTNSKIDICIEDTGIGISKKDLVQVFDPFFSTSPAGTGLGLPIVKKIVQDHDGEIDITSVPSEGTRVSLSLNAVSESKRKKSEKIKEASL